MSTLRQLRNLRLRGCLVILAAAILMAAPRPAAAGGSLSLDLVDSLLGNVLGRQRVIIQTKGRPSFLLLTLIRTLGGTILTTYTSIDALAVDLPLGSLLAILQRNDVEHVSSDLTVLGSMDLTTSAVQAATARQANSLTGAGIGIAVLDTGIAPHSDLVTPSNRIVGWTDLVAGRTAAYDDSGHGTHIAGIIAGNGGAAAKAGRSLTGIAPGANLIGVKVLDNQMKGTTSRVLSGIDFCLVNRTKWNIRVANLSLGQPVYSSYRDDPLCRGVEKLWNAGVVVITSAGNYGRSNPSDPNSAPRNGYVTSPGNDPLVITVGATNTVGTTNYVDDAVASYSSRGPTNIDHILKPDLVAPGNNVLSLGTNGALAQAAPANQVALGGASYFRLSGTSMAAPVVSGAVALMLQKASTLTPDTIKIRLMHSAIKQWDWYNYYNPYARGAGLLNVVQALKQPEKATRAAASPIIVRQSQPGQFGLQGSDALFGDMEYWNGVRLWGNTPLWGDATYGAPGTDTQGWADDGSWGNGALWGDPNSYAGTSKKTWSTPAPTPD